jgi:excisionase family DNA binding protein
MLGRGRRPARHAATLARSAAALSRLADKQGEVEPAATNAAERPRGRFLRVPEVAERLGVNRSTVYRLVQDRSLPAIQLRKNGTVRIDEAELDAWLYEQGDE